MGRQSLKGAQRIGPMLWARFIKRHFGCASLAPLNAQLLLPVTPFEIFEFEVEPAPLPLRLAPKIFERAYDLGRDPDGAYTPEIHGPDSKSEGALRFNLYERVTQRVPESKHWLLKELKPYLEGKPPLIDTTVRLLSELLSELGLALLDQRTVSSLERVHEGGLRGAEKATIGALSRCLLPEYLALTYALSHLCVWQGKSGITDELSDTLLKLCQYASIEFLFSLERHGLDLDPELQSIFLGGLLEGEWTIRESGVRSTSKGGRPYSFPCRLVLVPDTAATRQAIHILTEAFNDQSSALKNRTDYLEFLFSHFRQLTPLEADADTLPAMPTCENPTDIGMPKLTLAAHRLCEAALEVGCQFKERADRILSGYHPPQSRHASKKKPKTSPT